MNQSLIIFSGVPLTGKSKLAREVKKWVGIDYLDVDQIRNEVLPSPKKRLSEKEEQEKMKIAYEVMYERAREILRSGKSVILVATHSRSSFHYRFVDITNELSVPLYVFKIVTPLPVIETRLLKRKKNHYEYSNIRTFADYQKIADRFEDFDGETIVLHSTDPIAHNIQKIVDTISSSQKHLS